jgi:hypothetical protein
MKEPTHVAVWQAENEPVLDGGNPPRPIRHFRLAEHRTPDRITSRVPVHSALVQKSVATNTNFAGRLSVFDARESKADSQEENPKKMAAGLLGIQSRVRRLSNRQRGRRLESDNWDWETKTRRQQLNVSGLRPKPRRAHGISGWHAAGNPRNRQADAWPGDTRQQYSVPPAPLTA